MVWSTDTSMLHKTVKQYNNKSIAPPQEEKNNCTQDKDTTPRCTDRAMPRSPAHSLPADGDMLLITAVMLILIHEHADTKLIIALAIIMLL